MMSRPLRLLAFENWVKVSCCMSCSAAVAILWLLLLSHAEDWAANPAPLCAGLVAGWGLLPVVGCRPHLFARPESRAMPVSAGLLEHLDQRGGGVQGKR